MRGRLVGGPALNTCGSKYFPGIFLDNPRGRRIAHTWRLPIKKAVSGFIEWSPKIKSIEEKWVRRIADHGRRHGFVPVETAAVEYLSTLQIKGEIEKEIYCLTKPGSDMSKDLALHYDLTVPLARYVTE
ncbi:MAG: hypothetical protein HC902_14945, partial [Calothrix sp. SM1_5_4]|nr:hypothetical protein [Calothrix sp. SM1_5_4]